EADAGVGPGHAADQLERGAEAPGRNEAELARGDRVAAARDDHRPDAAERRRAAGPVGERQQWVARAAFAVGGDRARVEGSGSFRMPELLGLARPGPKSLEDRAVGLLRRMGEVAV